MRNKKVILITLTFLALCVSIFIVNHEVTKLSHEEWFVFDGIINFFKYGLSILLSLIIVQKSLKYSKLFQTKLFLIPILILSLSTLIVTFIIFSNNHNKGGEVFLHAYYDGDINGTSLTLRKDKSYEINNGSLLGGDIYKGNYYISTDTIFLDKKEPFANNFINHFFIIKRDKILFTKNKNGEFDTTYFTLKIIEVQNKNGG